MMKIVTMKFLETHHYVAIAKILLNVSPRFEGYRMSEDLSSKIILDPS
jgi:hypothetical protein